MGERSERVSVGAREVGANILNVVRGVKRSNPLPSLELGDLAHTGQVINGLSVRHCLGYIYRLAPLPDRPRRRVHALRRSIPDLERHDMKSDIQPEYATATVKCACG